ncbi:hypothetical protein C2S52_019087 [Perilla frutescens var. hirtella]|nr:hypothetical protein C2S52_019087 [Perilla frutescens var. hirtella]
MGSSNVKYHTCPWASSSVNVANFVTVKPSLQETEGSDDERSNNFKIWKDQMLCLLESQDVAGFVGGGGGDCSDEEKQWRRTDRLVKGWILASLGKDVLEAVWEKQTAMDVWLELHSIFNSKKAAPQIHHNLQKSIMGEDLSRFSPLCQAALRGDWDTVQNFFEDVNELSTTIITNYSETVLHVAVLTGKANDLAKKLVELTPAETLPALKDSGGRTALHNAAIVGNTEAAIALVHKNPGLLHISTNQNRLAVNLAATYCKETVEYLISEHEKHNNPPLFEGQHGILLFLELISSKFVGPAK